MFLKSFFFLSKFVKAIQKNKINKLNLQLFNVRNMPFLVKMLKSLFMHEAITYFTRADIPEN